jgi:hypothetical protein
MLRDTHLDTRFSSWCPAAGRMDLAYEKELQAPARYFHPERTFYEASRPCRVKGDGGLNFNQFGPDPRLL